MICPSSRTTKAEMSYSSSRATSVAVSVLLMVVLSLSLKKSNNSIFLTFLFMKTSLKILTGLLGLSGIFAGLMYAAEIPGVG